MFGSGFTVIVYKLPPPKQEACPVVVALAKKSMVCGVLLEFVRLKDGIEFGLLGPPPVDETPVILPGKFDIDHVISAPVVAEFNDTLALFSPEQIVWFAIPNKTAGLGLTVIEKFSGLP